MRRTLVSELRAAFRLPGRRSPGRAGGTLTRLPAHF